MEPGTNIPSTGTRRGFQPLPVNGEEKELFPERSGKRRIYGKQFGGESWVCLFALAAGAMPERPWPVTAAGAGAAQGPHPGGSCRDIQISLAPGARGPVPPMDAQARAG